MAAITASAEGGNWNAVKSWVGEKVPVAADDVTLASTSGSITVSAAAACRSLNATEYKKTLTVSETFTLSVGTTTSNTGLCWKLGAGMVLTGAGKISFISTSGTVEKISMAGLKFAGIVKFSATGGKWELTEKLATEASLEFEKGEFKTGNFEIASTSNIAILKNSGVGSFIAGSSIIKANKFTVGAGGTGVWTCGTSTVEISGASAQVGASTTFGLNESPFNKLVIASAGAEFLGANIISELVLETAGLAATKFPRETAQTITKSISGNGKAGSLVKIESTTSTKAWKLTSSVAQISVDFFEIKDSKAEGAAEWFAGTHSTNVSGNTGWKFEAPPILGEDNVAMIV